MAIKDHIKSWLGIPGVSARATSTEALQLPPRMSGRVSVNEETDVLLLGFSSLTPAIPDYEREWRDYSLDSDALSRVSSTKLMQLLADLSPDVSRALWDDIRFCNPGWEVRAYNVGRETENKAAKQALDAFLSNLHGPYTAENGVPADTVINSLIISIILRGAVFSELVLDESGRVPLEIATPDPSSVRFRRIRDSVRGPVWQMGQWQRGEFVTLDRPTIQYVPVDPFPGSPYGRPLAAPALFTSLFLLGLLHDLRRVVAQQGYPRLDISINMERLQKAIPAGLDAVNQKEWADRAIQQVVRDYATLQPDDAYVHPDFVTVNRPVGAVDSSSLGAVEGLIKALERMLVRSLKTFDLFFGTGDGSGNEASANRKWELKAASIKALQHLLETSLEKTLALALRVQGIAADVEFRFSELRASELLRDAQVEALQIKNEREKYAAGWTTQDEGSEAITGHKAAEQEPRASAGSVGDLIPTGGMAADPGSERAAIVYSVYRMETNYAVPYQQWWRERLGDPPDSDAAYERLRELLAAPVWVPYGGKPNGDGEVIG